MSRVDQGALLGAACGMGVGALAWWAEQETWSVAKELLWTRGSGYLALVALVASLSVSPVVRLFGRGGALTRIAREGTPGAGVGMRARRALGMTAAGLGLLHAAVALATTLRGAWASVLSWPHLRAGALALTILMLLLLTSFPALVRRMRLRAWKELHRSVYLAFACALVHALTSPFVSHVLAIALGVSAMTLVLLRTLAWAVRS